MNNKRFHFTAYFNQNQIYTCLLRAIITLLGIITIIPIALADDTCDPNILNEIKGQVVLPPNCTYRRAIRIIDSNTTLDCRGSTFIGDKGSKKIGLLIDSLGMPMSDVIVKNCNFHNFERSGVRVTWSEIDAKKGSNHEEIYSRSPTRILLENISVKDNGGVGIYLDDYVSNVTIKDSKIIGSGAVGIYLEHSSKYIKLLNNKIIGNGFGNATKKHKREGIAVDSSSNNVIEGNVFQSNSGGGVFLYKNCGEHISSGEQVIRWQHSDHNMIKKNLFADEKVGIWLASRQGKKFPHLDCGDSPINERGEYADFADFNQIEDNIFCRTVVSVTDNGRHNEIRGSKSLCPLNLQR